MTTGGGPLEAIVLAAGSGRRFGGDKLTSPWREGVLIDGALNAAFDSPARRVVVVTGADPEVEGAARAFAERQGEATRLRIVHAEDHARGLSASLRAGLSALAAETVGFFVFLGDMPRIPLALAAEMAAAFRGRIMAVAPRFEGQRGHPVLFARSLAPSLAELTGDRGARAILDRLGDRLALIETSDPGVLYDIDLRDDLRS